MLDYAIYLGFVRFPVIASRGRWIVDRLGVCAEDYCFKQMSLGAHHVFRLAILGFVQESFISNKFITICARCITRLI